MPDGLYVTIGGPLYWIAILALLIGLAVLIFLSKKLGKAFTWKFVLIMYWVNFAQHFLKQFMPGYFGNWPEYLARSSVENFCALFVVVAPFFLLSKKKILYDYLFYMGTISALGAYFMPTSPAVTNLLSLEGAFEISRYYLCHAPILYGGIMLVCSGLHHPDYKRFVWVPLMITAALGVCYVNCIIMNVALNNFPWNEMASRENPFMNSSFANGPGHNYDSFLGWLYPYLFNHLQYYYDSTGEFCFTPVLWTLPVFYLVSPIFFLTLCLPFEYKHIKADFASSPYKGRVDKK